MESQCPSAIKSLSCGEVGQLETAKEGHIEHIPQISEPDFSDVSLSSRSVLGQEQSSAHPLQSPELSFAETPRHEFLVTAYDDSSV